jgi:hypothetical protein
VKDISISFLVDILDELIWHHEEVIQKFVQFCHESIGKSPSGMIETNFELSLVIHRFPYEIHKREREVKGDRKEWSIDTLE